MAPWTLEEARRPRAKYIVVAFLVTKFSSAGRSARAGNKPAQVLEL